VNGVAAGKGERFELRRWLGAGGHGEVYEAIDRARDRVVALKKLRRFEAGPLLRFKQEFRALANVRHPNLVRLDELMARGDEWFFTMELVDGPDLVQYVRRENRSPLDAGISTALTLDQPTPAGDSDVPAPPGVASPGRAARFDETRLRDAFGQLATGVQALHAAGMLHRDLKPSNVLVARDGRVVILDFGLVADLAGEEAARSVHIVGTPAYMSPEQAGGREVSRASDWYSVGVTLYEALTGRLPFEGALHELIFRRQTSEPPHARDLEPDIPADLDALCHELLRLDPAGRPAGEEVVSRLQRRPAALRRAAPAAERFIGRQAELAALGEALERVRAGQPAAVLVSGASGMGKTALVRRFLAQLRGRDRSALVLSGRCYQRESVPYKALDSVVDGLSRYLRGLPPLEAARYMPREHAALARLFPVLREIGEAGASRRAAAEIPDAQELRRRGLAGLKELLGRLADQLTVALFVDDLQWGDLDSGYLLRELLRPPDAPPMLLLACFRREDAERSPLLRMIAEDAELAGVRYNLEIAELPTADAEALALAAVGGHDPAARARAETIARESGGNPFFVDELARHRLPAGPAGTEAIRLDTVIQSRVAQLPDDARRLLEVVVVAGEPLDLEIARRAAELAGGYREAIDVLQAEHWVRPCALDDREAFEPFHDRVRESVVAIVPADRHAGHHRRLALALEEAGTASAATLAEHCMGAGERERAAAHAVRAGDEAAVELAFDRAAKLYELALEAGRWSAAEVGPLRAKRGQALANAGRGAEAAREFLGAAGSATSPDSRELRRRAAEQLLITGHIDAGREVLQAVLAAVGLRLARTPARALAGLLARRLQLALRGLRFTPRPAGEIAPERLARVDASWAASVGLGMVDTIRGAQFQALNLLYALRAGEPRRVARALAMEMAFSSSGGGRTRRRTSRLQRRCREMVDALEDPYTSGLFAVYEGMIASFEGRWGESLSASARGEAILREGCTGATWELDSAQLYQLHALANGGHWRELAARAPVLLHEANGRGDLYLASYIRSRNLYLLHLAEDDPGGAREQQARSLDGWSQQGFQVQHYWDWFARGEIDLYDGQPRAAWKRLASGWGAFRRSLLPRAQAVFLEAVFLRARAAVALAVQAPSGERASLLRHAERDARRLEREAMAWGDAMATLVAAAVATTRGQSERASHLAGSAEERFAAVEMEQFAAAARWRRGQLTAGAEGESLVAEACSRLEAQGVRNPARMVEMLAPGSWNARSD
jgi:hypothetical protein